MSLRRGFYLEIHGVDSVSGGLLLRVGLHTVYCKDPGFPSQPDSKTHPTARHFPGNQRPLSLQLLTGAPLLSDRVVWLRDDRESRFPFEPGMPG